MTEFPTVIRLHSMLRRNACCCGQGQWPMTACGGVGQWIGALVADAGSHGGEGAAKRALAHPDAPSPSALALVGALGLAVVATGPGSGGSSDSTGVLVSNAQLAMGTSGARPASCSLAANLLDPDYVRILCGTLNDLPAALAAVEGRPDPENLQRNNRNSALRKRNRCWASANQPLLPPVPRTTLPTPLLTQDRNRILTR